MTTYYSETQGLTYRIVGYLGRTKHHETYVGRSSKPQRTIVLHLRRNGHCRLYPKAPKVAGVEIKAPGSQKSMAEQVLPWTAEGERRPPRDIDE